MKTLPALIGVALLPVFLVFSGCGRGAAFQGESSSQAAPADGHPRTIVDAGLVTDGVGIPVARLPVQFSASRRPLQPDPRLDLKRRKVLVSGMTASDGTYRLIVPLGAGRMKYYMNFYQRGVFDELRFARPNRIDITALLGKGKPLVLFDHKLPFHGAWGRVQKTIKAYPEGSPKARIIRRYGIAEEVRKDRRGRAVEVWWYYSMGKRFDFKGDKVVSEKSFSPILK
jgi:hypothetical protein